MDIQQAIQTLDDAREAPKANALRNLIEHTTVAPETNVFDVLDGLDAHIEQWQKNSDLAESTMATYKSRVRSGLEKITDSSEASTDSDSEDSDSSKDSTHSAPSVSQSPDKKNSKLDLGIKAATINLSLEDGREVNVELPESWSVQEAKYLAIKLLAMAGDLDPSKSAHAELFEVLQS